jgi:hypothetical protein
MTPAYKYSLGRLGLFVLVLLATLPLPIDIILKLMIAIVGSFALQFVLLRKWRREMISTIDDSVAKRKVAKERLRAALAGDDAPADRRNG